MTDETHEQRLPRDRILPKRFYKLVTLGADCAILLDGREVKTPLKKPLVLPTKALGEAVAGEWRAQTQFINPAMMPLTTLANTAIDRTRLERAHRQAGVAAFAAHDLVCYRAEGPDRLVELQAQYWNPVVLWARSALAAALNITIGVRHVEQPASALKAVTDCVQRLDDFSLTGVIMLTTLTGSALLALMLQADAITAEAAWVAAHVDEDFQISLWGKDDEAAQRRGKRKAEFAACDRFLKLTAAVRL